MNDLKLRRHQMIKGMQDSLRVIRQVIDISAQELGDYIGVSRQTINNIETKKTTLNASQYISIAALLDRKVGSTEGTLEQIKAVLNARSEGDTVIQLKDDSFLEGWYGTYEELHVNREIFQSKVLDVDDLTTLCENYRIFMTHDVFESDCIEQFIFKLIPCLTDANTKILMPAVAVDIIENKLQSTDKEVISKARRAHNILLTLDKAGLLDIRHDAENRDLEEIISDVFMMHRESYNMALFTQNKNLTERIFALNDIKTNATLPIIVCCVNEDGNAERSLLDDEDKDALAELKELLSTKSVINEEINKSIDRVLDDLKVDEDEEEFDEEFDEVESDELSEDEAPMKFRPMSAITGWDI